MDLSVVFVCFVFFVMAMVSRTPHDFYAKFKELKIHTRYYKSNLIKYKPAVIPDFHRNVRIITYVEIAQILVISTWVIILKFL